MTQRAIRDSVEGFLLNLIKELNLGSLSSLDLANEFDKPSELEYRSKDLLQTCKQALNKVWSRCNKMAEQTAKRRVLESQSHIPLPKSAPENSMNMVVWRHENSAIEKPRAFQRGAYRAVASAPKLQIHIEPSRVLHVDASRTPVHTDIKELNKAKQLTSFLWTIFMTLGGHGTKFEDYESLNLGLRKKYEDMWFENVVQKPVTTLAAAVGRWTSWETWADSNSAQVYNILAVHVRLYLKSLEDKGPTAAKGAYVQLRWLELNVGCFFHTELKDVKDQAAAQGDHIERQVAPMKLVWWIKLELLATGSNEFVKAVCLTWCIIITCVLRFAHVQRSHNTAITDRSYEMHCSANKTKALGKCRPSLHVAQDMALQAWTWVNTSATSRDAR